MDLILLRLYTFLPSVGFTSFAKDHLNSLHNNIVLHHLYGSIESWLVPDFHCLLRTLNYQNLRKKMIGGTPEVRSDKKFNLIDICHFTFYI